MRKTIRMVAMVAGLAVLSTGGAAVAQTRPMTPAPPSHDPGSAATHAPDHQSHQARAGQGTMMCPMMGQPMMGTADPKAQARMLKLRGDMMKAMGEVMLKHAQEIEQAR
jgi:hypothetical protein